MFFIQVLAISYYQRFWYNFTDKNRSAFPFLTIKMFDIKPKVNFFKIDMKRPFNSFNPVYP